MKDKVVFVTGAATGIGRETAILFAQKGAKLVIADYNQEELKKTAGFLDQEGASHHSVVGDVSKEEDVRKMVSACKEKFGKLDIAVNNAGIGGKSTATAEYETDDWDEVLNINLKGQFLCMKYEIRSMLENGGGSIVNIASILGKVGFAEAPAYVAAKHGLVGLTKNAALEYSAKGIRVNAVCPGFIETPMLEKAGLTTDKETKDFLVSLHPIGRLGNSREVANAIYWIASSEASFVTGHTLMVDGGYTAR